MKEREELELVKKLIGKYNLPLSPNLDDAIKDKIDEYSEVEKSENDDILDNVSSVESEIKTENTIHYAVQGNNNNLDNSAYYKDCKIENKANQCFIINKDGKRIYSSSGKLKILDGKIYRILYNNSAISINLVQWDEKKEKYRLGDRIVYEGKNSPLYDCLDKTNFLDQIKAIMYEQNKGEYRVKVAEKWYSCIGEKKDKEESEIVNSTENSEPRVVSLTESQNNPKCGMEIVELSQSSIAVIGDTTQHVNSFKALGGYYMYRTKWGPAWVFHAQKRDIIQAYINGQTSVANSLEDKNKGGFINKSQYNKSNEANQGKYSSHFDIRVQYPNGSVSCSKDAGDTLVDVVLYAGPEKVRQLNIYCLGNNLVSSQLGKNSIYRAAQKKIAKGLFLCVCSSNEFIYQQIQTINNGCHLGLIVEKIYLDKTRKSKTIPVSSKAKPVLDNIPPHKEITYSFNGKHHLSKSKIQHKPAKEKKESQQVISNQGSPEDRRIGYIVRLLPSQERGIIVRVVSDEEGYKKLIVKTDEGVYKVIDDNPFLYVILKRKG